MRHGATLAMDDEAQMSATTAREGGGARNAPSPAAGAESEAVNVHGMALEGRRLMEAVVERENLWRAYERVMRNKGAGGIDKMTVEQLKPHLQQHWPRIRQALLEGSYMPQAVRAVDIPKTGSVKGPGGVRTLGIPTVVDRLIQQALLQVLQPILEPTFSDSSHGFRPGRSAQQAVRQASRYIAQGRTWVVDVDLEKFFDRVSHDILMQRLSRYIEDARVLKLIRRYLEAGMLREGLVSLRTQGTPQGGPLSPLLSNVLLTDLDRELERRGLSFARYADDCNIFVRSQKAGEHLMGWIVPWLEHTLKLRVNPDKSAVDRTWRRAFLGYAWQANGKRRIAATALSRLRQAVKAAVRLGCGLAKTVVELTPLLRGWMGYFKLTEARKPLEELDGWIRRRLRCLLWRQAKRIHARARMLMRRQLEQARAWKSATNGRGPWWNSGASHMNQAFPKAWFTAQGLVSLLDTHQRLLLISRTAVCGTARTVV
jgi:RNA-directed DNA polymerase